MDLVGAIDIVKTYDKWTKTDRSALGDVLQSKLPEDNGEDKDESIKFTDIQVEIKDILDKWR